MNESCHTYDRRADTAGTTRDEDEKSGIVFVWKYMCLYLYIFILPLPYICTCICMRQHIDVYSYVYLVQRCIFTSHIQTRIHLYECMYVSVYIRTCVYVLYVCVYIHMHICIYFISEMWARILDMWVEPCLEKDKNY